MPVTPRCDKLFLVVFGYSSYGNNLSRTVDFTACTMGLFVRTSLKLGLS